MRDELESPSEPEGEDGYGLNGTSGRKTRKTNGRGTGPNGGMQSPDSDQDPTAESNKLISNLLDTSNPLVRGTLSHDRVEAPSLDPNLVIESRSRARQALMVLEESRALRS